ncbi:MAG: hypothetical protein GOV02_03270 [Candidatus Aenigmarchaeota archaeon]|nr:hypothetical protein [Candidatus Aenigmarchaeota archaeon]
MKCPICNCLHEETKVDALYPDNIGDICAMCQKLSTHSISIEIYKTTLLETKNKYKDVPGVLFDDESYLPLDELYMNGLKGSDNGLSIRRYYSKSSNEFISNEEMEFLSSMAENTLEDGNKKTYDWYYSLWGKVEKDIYIRVVDIICLEKEKLKMAIDIGYNKFLISRIRRATNKKPIERCRSMSHQEGIRCKNQSHENGKCYTHRNKPISFTDDGVNHITYDINDISATMSKQALFLVCTNLIKNQGLNHENR